MNIQVINGINNYNNSQIKFGNSLSEQLGLTSQVRQAVDSYMPEIKKEIKTMVANEMRATKSSISNETDAKIDTYDKFNKIKEAVQDAKRTGSKSQLEKALNCILAEKQIDLNSRTIVLNQLKSNPYKRKEFLDNSL